MAFVESFLAEMIGVSERAVINGSRLVRGHDGYNMVKIPKKSGGHRIILIPHFLLKDIQSLILRRILKRMWPFSHQHAINGIAGKTSHVNHAGIHRTSRWVLQLDIKDAFLSVDIDELRRIVERKIKIEAEIFQSSWNQYSELKMIVEKKKINEWWDYRDSKAVEEEKEYYSGKILEQERAILGSIFSPITTKQLSELENYPHHFPQLSDLIIELTTFKGILPPGAPTSPFLFYLVLLEGGLIEKFIKICDQRYFFSVYVDNFVISSKKPIPEKDKEKIFEAMTHFGFTVNKKKTRYQDIRQGSPLITGLSLNPEKKKVILPKKEVRRMRGFIHKAIYNPDLRSKAVGMVASIFPVYKEMPPPQIREAYYNLLLKIGEEKQV